MPSIQERFRSLSKAPAPDLWPDIEDRTSGPMPAEPRGRRFVAASVALILATTGIGLAVVAIRSDPAVERGGSGPARANGQIAVAQGPDADIVLVDPVTGASTDLVERHGEGHEGGLQMAWAPDGSMLAYTDYRDDSGLIGLFVLDLASRGVTDLSPGLSNADSPAWSPLGDVIAFTGFEGTTGYEIYVVAADGTGLGPVTSEANDGVSGGHMPAWSPDGTMIAYNFDRYDGSTQTERHGIAVVDLEGREETVVDSPAVVENPVWSPEGTRIAFLVKMDDQTEIHVSNADGIGTWSVAIDRRDIGAPVPPSWSPQGGSLVFASIDRQTSSPGITVVSSDDAGAPAILEDADPLVPVWAPAGDLIAFVRVDGAAPTPASSLWVMRPDGSAPIELVQGLDLVSEIAWQPLPANPAPSTTILQDGSVSSDGSLLPEGRLLIQVDGQHLELLDEGTDTSSVVGRDLFALDLSPDGARALVTTPWESGGSETALISLDLTTGERTTITEFEGWSIPARWSPDGSMVAYRVGERDTMCIWEAAPRETRCLPETGPVYAFDWSPDGTRLVLDQPPPRLGSLTVLDVETEQTSVVAAWDDPAVLDAVAAAGLGAPVAIQFQGPQWSPSGRFIASLAMVRTDDGWSGNIVLVFDLSGSVVAQGIPFREFSEARGWSPAADVFAYASGEPPYRIVDARLLDATTGEERLLVSTANEDRTISSLARSPSGRWLAVSLDTYSGWSYTSEIRIIDMTGMEPPRTFRSQTLVELVDWGP